MNWIRKKELLEKIDQEIKKSQVIAQKRATAAKRAKGFSRSMQGDRRYFEDADRIAQESLANLIALRKEVESASNEPAKVAQPVSFVTLEHEEGETGSFYLVENSASLAGIQLLTPDSPLGKAIVGKEKGDKFSYRVEEGDQHSTYSGKIKKVE